MDRKRLILASLFLLVCLIIGYFLYAVFFASKKPTTKVPEPTEAEQAGAFPTSGQGAPRPAAGTGANNLPTSGGAPSVPTSGSQEAPILRSGEVSQLVDARVTGVDANKNGHARFYNDQDGKFYKIVNGKLEPLSDQVFFNVKDVAWSPTADEGIIEYPDGANIYYNFETKKQATLPKHWESFSFSPTGDKIAAKSIAFSAENRWLVAADPEGGNIELIEPLGNNADKVIVNWSPNKQILALSLTGQELGADRQEVLFVGKNGENMKSAIVEGRGIVPSWSKTGEKLLYSVYSSRSSFKPELWITGGQGDDIGSNRKLLELNTWADKCTFSDDRFVYCGVPKTLPDGAGFAPSLADNTQDDLYKIDTETGIKTKLPLNEDHSIGSVYVGDNGKSLYFTDKNKTGLYSIPL